MVGAGRSVIRLTCLCNFLSLLHINYCSSKVCFVHSNTSSESSAGIGVLNMAKHAMLRMPGTHKIGELGEGHNQFWVLDKDVSLIYPIKYIVSCFLPVFVCHMYSISTLVLSHDF